MSEPWEDDSGYDEEPAFFEVDGDQVVGGEVVADLDGTTGPVDEEDDDDDADMDGNEDASPGPSFKPERDDATATYAGHRGEPVYCVAWSPSSDVVASGGGDDRAHIWRAGDTGAAAVLGAHQDSVSCVGFSHDGALLASGGMDGRVMVWNAQTGEAKGVLEGPGDSIEWLSWHPRGHVLLAGSADYTCWMWNADTGAFMQLFSGHSASVTCGRFTPDGKSVVTASLDGTVRAWAPRSGDCAGVVQGGGGLFHEGGVVSMDVHHDGAAVLTGGEDADAFLSQPGTGKVVGKLVGHEHAVEAVGFCPLAPIMATADASGKMLLWDAGSLQQRGVCQHTEGRAVVAIRWHPSTPLAVTACADGMVRVWDSRSGSCVLERTGHTEPILDLALSPDGARCITAADDGTSRVFSLVP